MVFADPPYGVSFQSNMRIKSRKFTALTNDDSIWDGFIGPVIGKTAGWVLVCTSWKVLMPWMRVTRELGDLANLIVWNKGGGGIGDLKHSLSTDFELILAYNRGHTIKGKRIGSVWDVGKDAASSYKHPTQKPVGLSGLALRAFTNKGNGVYDPFSGSGSTLIACEQLGRMYVGLEIDPRYCDVILRRYASFRNEDPAKYFKAVQHG